MNRLILLFLSIFLLTTFLNSTASPTFAQDNGQVVTATVQSASTTLHSIPAMLTYSGETVIAEFPQGEIVTVLAFEDAIHFNSSRDWVYVQVNASGQSGWMDAADLSFSRLDWQDAVLIYSNLMDLSNFVLTSQNPLVGVAWSPSLGVPTYLWREAYYGTYSDLIGPKELIEIIGVSLINGEHRSVYVRSIERNIEGWISAYFVQLPFKYSGFGVDYSLDWLDVLPVVYESNIDIELSHLPQAVVNIRGYHALNIRETPFADSPSLRTLRYNTPLFVHGRTSHDKEGWVFVTVTGGRNYPAGLSGWVFDPNWDTPYLVYLNEVTRDSLPILSSNFQP